MAHRKEDLLAMTHSELDAILGKFGYKPSGNSKDKKAERILELEKEAEEAENAEPKSKPSIMDKSNVGGLSNSAISAIIEKRKRDTNVALGAQHSYVDAVINQRRGTKKVVALTSEEVIKARKQGIKLTR